MLATFEASALPTLTISQIARVIRQDWGVKINYAAKPYLDAMRCVDTLDQSYGCEDGRTQVLYFLSNATTWRGDVAKAVKAELNRRLKAK